VDSDAFADLFQQHYRSLVRFVYYRIGDRTSAEDLASETFAIAWRKQMEGILIDVRWLFVTARNLIGNEYQRRAGQRYREEQAVMGMLASVEAWSDAIDDIDLRLAMARLRPEDALVLQLTYFDGLTTRQAAAFLDCSLGAFWVRQTRARAALRTLLEDPDRACSVGQPKPGELDG